MKYYNNKFCWDLWFFILGFILLTSYDVFANVSNNGLTNNFIDKLSITPKKIFNTNFNDTNQFELNVLNNTNVSDLNGSTHLKSPLGYVSQFSSGSDHTCAIDNEGKLFCWGYNNYGQLGDNSTTDKSTPTPVNSTGHLNDKTVISVSAGESHTCAINSDNQLFCWGRNNDGRLGDGTKQHKRTPTPIDSTGLLNGNIIISVSAGYTHTCAINSNNKLLCWGGNSHGQVGDGSKKNDRNTPTPVNTNGLLNEKSVISVSTGYGHTCAINSDNELFCWGWNSYGQLGDESNTDSYTPILVNSNGLLNEKSVISVSAGYSHTCAINSDNELFCWGSNGGALGNGSGSNQNTPTPIYSNGFLNGKSVISVNAGQFHTCATNSDNELFCWGHNDYGQLGDGSNSTIYTPIPVNSTGLLNGKSVIGVSAGDDHTCAINSDNQLLCWGRNNFGQLGDGSNSTIYTPTPVNSTGLLNEKAVISVSTGQYHTCAINSDGKLFCWGANNVGQLGDGSNKYKYTPIPVNSNGLLNEKTVISVSTGQYHTCAINSDNQLFCWGYNKYGQLGDGSKIHKNTPTLVSTNESFDINYVKSVSTGNSHTCAINYDNKLFCWGANNVGQLGDGSNSTVYTPNPVNSTGLLNDKAVISVSTGYYNNTCAINSDNKLYCWGYNDSGQLGNGSNSTIYTPNPVSTNESFEINSVKSVNAGHYHTCAINSHDKLYCWGYNDSGQLGNGSNSTIYTPNPVSSNKFFDGNSIKSVSAGYLYTCAINSDDELFCWGQNDSGQLGDGTKNNKNTPTPVNSNWLLNGKSVISVSAGWHHTCAINSEGELFCWGYNGNGQLGNEVNTDKNLPTLITVPQDEICNGIDDDLDGDTDEGFTVISGVCYANSDIENIDECNATDIVINNRCYNPEDYNKKDNKITEKVQPLPAIVTTTNTQGKINILMQKFTITQKMKKKLKKRALKKFGIKNAKLKVYYSYIITKISDSYMGIQNIGAQSINEFAKNGKNKVIKEKVKLNQTVKKKLPTGTYTIKYKVTIQAIVNKKPELIWGNQKSNKSSIPVNFTIAKKIK